MRKEKNEIREPAYGHTFKKISFGISHCLFDVFMWHKKHCARG